MFYIHCPYCQEARSEEEFSYSGEAHIQRPASPETLTDEQWGDYLFFRKNPRGIHHEMWCHTAACRRYFHVTRDTVSYRILATQALGTQAGVMESGGERGSGQ
jgi:sarcosine oxidase subunit delta